MKYPHVFVLCLMPVFLTFCGQSQTVGKEIMVNAETKEVTRSHGPASITRNIIQDKKGNIWMAAFDGIFRYDTRLNDSVGQGKSFTHITRNLTSSRFFSVLEDRKGNFWFGTVGIDGSGVYYYDGKSLPTGQAGFLNFTTKEGLLNNEVGCIYEDKKGNIWFGVSGGASCYDGKSFRNYIIDANGIHEDRLGKRFPTRQSHLYTVNTIIEDKTGKFWFGSGGNTFVYDARLPDGQGKKFTIFNHDDKPFENVRTIIEDKKGNIWLSGTDGLWQYDGNIVTNFMKNFVGYIYEDKKGNIWTSNEVNREQGWTLSKYDGVSVSDIYLTATDIIKEKMIFGILEANDGSIWFGTLDGVKRYDGKTITDFKSNERQK